MAFDNRCTNDYWRYVYDSVLQNGGFAIVDFKITFKKCNEYNLLLLHKMIILFGFVAIFYLLTESFDEYQRFCVN